jgi:hypothetical protein
LVQRRKRCHGFDRGEIGLVYDDRRQKHTTAVHDAMTDRQKRSVLAFESGDDPGQ